MARSLMTQRPGRWEVWREPGLGLSLMVLFLASWVAHGISEWQTYTDTRREQPADAVELEAGVPSAVHVPHHRRPVHPQGQRRVKRLRGEDGGGVAPHGGSWAPRPPTRRRRR